MDRDGGAAELRAGVDVDRFRRVYTPEVLDRLRALSATHDPAHVLVAGRGLA